MLDQWTRFGLDRDARRIEHPREALPRTAADVNALLRTLPKLRNLSGPAWQRALASATVVNESPGTQLAVPSCNTNHFTVVLRGALMLRGRSEDGRIFNMYKVRPGEVCTLSLLMLRDMASTLPVSEVFAEGDLLLLRIPAQHLDGLVTESREFRELMLASMTRCVRHMLGLIEEVTFDGLRTRIERHLRDMHRASGADVLKLGHQELANELGSTREGISRLLKRMERCGHIRLGRGAITLLPQFPR